MQPETIAVAPLRSKENFENFMNKKNEQDQQNFPFYIFLILLQFALLKVQSFDINVKIHTIELLRGNNLYVYNMMAALYLTTHANSDQGEIFPQNPRYQAKYLLEIMFS